MAGENVFAEIQRKIAGGKIDLAVAETLSLAGSHSGDRNVLLKCASLLKAIGDSGAFRKVASMLLSSAPEDGPERIDLGTAFVGLGLFAEACEMFDSAENPPAIPYARALIGCGRHGDALGILPDGTVEAKALRVDALCALDRHDEAVALCEADLGPWEIKKAYCGALIHSGDGKAAMKYVRKLSKKSKDADSNALSAYVLRIIGRTPAAAAYAGRALKADPHHLGALEEMALCLAEKGEFDKARYFAGAINEISPGNPATIRILDACA